MKKFVFTLAVCAAMVGFGADSAQDRAAKEAAKKALIEQRQKRAAELAKRQAEMKARRAAAEKQKAEKQKARDLEEARKKNISVEELYRQRAEKEAKRYNVPVDEWLKLDKRGRDAKKKDFMKARLEAVEKAKAEYLGLTVEEFRKREAERHAAERRTREAARKARAEQQKAKAKTPAPETK